MKSVRSILWLSTLFFSLCRINSAQAQTKQWQWVNADQCSDPLTYVGNTNWTSTDASGNVFAGGTFNADSMCLDGFTIHTRLQEGGGGFLAKFNPSGQLLWLKNIGPRTNYFAMDASGNVYASGVFRDTVSFGPFLLKQYSNSGVCWNLFLVKYDPSGHVLWATCPGGYSRAGSYTTSPYSMSMDASANIYIAGSFASDSLFFGSTKIASTGVASSTFLVKYNSHGQVSWAQRTNDVVINSVGQMIANRSGEVYIVTPYLLVAKYSPSGKQRWQKNLYKRNINFDYVKLTALAVDQNEHVYIAGAIDSIEVHVGSFLLIDSMAPSSWGPFISKMDSAGNLLWANTPAGAYSGTFRINALATSPNADLYMAGNFKNFARFKSFTLGSTITNQYNLESNYAYVVKVNPLNGDPVWGHSAYGGGDAWTGLDDLQAACLFIDAAENVFVGGNLITGPIAFDAIEIDGNGAYIAKLNIGAPAAPVSGTLIAFPNPSSGLFSMLYNLAGSPNSTALLKITNTAGLCVYQSVLPLNGIININLSAMAKGLYFLNMITDKVQVSRKIVIQ